MHFNVNIHCYHSAGFEWSMAYYGGTNDSQTKLQNKNLIIF